MIEIDQERLVIIQLLLWNDTCDLEVENTQTKKE